MIGDLKYVDYFDYLYEPIPRFCVQRNDYLTAVTTNTGVLLLKLHPDFDKTVNLITYYKLFIKPSSYMVIDNIDIDVGTFMFDLPQSLVHTCLMQSNVIGSLDNLKKKTFFVTKCHLSPMQIIDEEGIVATISDVGALDIYVKVSYITGITKYEHILNVNTVHIDRYKYRWKSITDMSSEDLLQETMRRLDMHTVKAVCWTHILERKINIHEKKDNSLMIKYCCLIVGYGDGNIVFWEFEKTAMADYKNAKLQFMFEYQTNLKEITAMCWHESNGNSGLLVIGDTTGKTIAIPMLDLVVNYCKNEKEIILTSETDIAVDHVEVEVKNDHVIVYVIQQVHVLFFVLNEEAELVQKLDYNCTNHNITAFQILSNKSILLSTLTGVIKELKTEIINNQLQVSTKQIYVNIDFSKNTLLGVFVSKNNAILSLITHHQGYFYKGPLKMKIWNFVNNDEDCFEKFLNIPRISDGFDLIEVLKVRSWQKKHLLANDLPEDIDYDSVSLTELKKHLCIARISESVFDLVDTVTQYNIKQSSDILTMINTQLSIMLLHKIVDELKTKGAVSLYKQEVGHVCYTHLHETVLSGFLKEHNLMHNYVTQIKNLLEDCEGLSVQDDLMCKICEHKLVGLTCPMGHSENRCSFTLVQLVNSKFKCEVCERYVSEEAVVFSKHLSCSLCDSPLTTVIGDCVAEFEMKEHCKADCLSNI